MKQKLGLGLRLPLQRNYSLYFLGFTKLSVQKELGKRCSQKEGAQRRCLLSAAWLLPPSPPPGAASPEQKDNKWHFNLKVEQQPGRFINRGIVVTPSVSAPRQGASLHPAHLHGLCVPLHLAPGWLQFSAQSVLYRA